MVLIYADDVNMHVLAYILQKKNTETLVVNGKETDLEAKAFQNSFRSHFLKNISLNSAY